ncbi:MAG: hypothetical protein KGL44_03745 [Sphingomonadales bacterium]|nr:hypothetical protein [Sphingomonadales bacterium]
MSFWEGLRRFGPGWPDQRGWYSLALFLQTTMILLLVALKPALASNDFFQSLATAIVVTGWVGYAVGSRDNRFDREQVGEAQQLARDIMDRMSPSPAERALRGAVPDLSSASGPSSGPASDQEGAL